MNLHEYIKKTVKECLNENLYTRLLSKDKMIELGASGSLDKAFERYIPVDKIVGLDPSPKYWAFIQPDKGKIGNDLKLFI